MTALWSIETSGIIHPTTQSHIPERRETQTAPQGQSPIWQNQELPCPTCHLQKSWNHTELTQTKAQTKKVQNRRSDVTLINCKAPCSFGRNSKKKKKFGRILHPFSFSPGGGLEMFPKNTNLRNPSNIINNYILTVDSWWNDTEYLPLLQNLYLILYSLQST